MTAEVRVFTGIAGIGFCVLWYHTRDRGYGLLKALGSASCDITHETGGTSCYGHWVLRLVISHTRQGVRLVTGIGFCLLWYHTRDKGYDLLRALGSASCDITDKMEGTMCYGHWVLPLAISLTRQGIRWVTGLGFCVLWYHTRDRGYGLLGAWSSASCNITHETGGTIWYRHWVLRLVILHTRQRVRLVTGIGFCVLWYLTHETGGTICYTGIGFSVLWHHTRDKGYDVLQALGPASCDITHETGGTICYGHWVLRLVTSHTKQGVRLVTGIGFCLLWYHIRDREYDLLRALGSASCDITHETGGTSCYGHWVLPLVITHTRKEVRFVTGTGFCILWYLTRNREYDFYGHWVRHPVISHTKQGVRFVTGIGFCILWYRTRDEVTICDGNWVLHLGISHTRQWKRFALGIRFCVLWYHTRGKGCVLLRALGSAADLRLVISHTRQGVRFATGIGFCVFWYHTRDKRYDLCGALGSASCDLTHETSLVISRTRQGVRFLWALGSASFDVTEEPAGTICYGHWVLRLETSKTRQGVRFATGIGFCILCYHTRDRGTICYGHWVLRLEISHARQAVRVVRGIGFCLLWYHTRDKRYDFLRALGSASCDISHEIGSTICYRHWSLCLVISDTKYGIRFVTGIGFCLLWYHARDSAYDLLRSAHTEHRTTFLFISVCMTPRRNSIYRQQ